MKRGSRSTLSLSADMKIFPAIASAKPHRPCSRGSVVSSQPAAWAAVPSQWPCGAVRSGSSRRAPAKARESAAQAGLGAPLVPSLHAQQSARCALRSRRHPWPVKALGAKFAVWRRGLLPPCSWQTPSPNPAVERDGQPAALVGSLRASRSGRPSLPR